MKVTDVQVGEGYILYVTFSDGLRRRVNVESVLWGVMFESLRDLAIFRQAAFDPQLGTVAWPNGADLAPEYLWEHGEAVTSAYSR